jgi:hypothetical protein
VKLWFLLLVIALFPGCDVATAALIFSAQKEDDDDGGEPEVLPSTGFGDFFKVWVADLANSQEADDQQTDLDFRNGNPDPAVWTEVTKSDGSRLAATDILDVDNAAVGLFNAILIQASSDENFNLDCVEILNAQNLVIEHASGTTWSNLVTTPDRLLGPPDGQCAVTTTVTESRAYIFTVYTSTPIDKIQINGYGTTKSRPPGDVIAIGKYASPTAERPGGVAVDSNGLIHVTLSVGDVGRLVRFNPAGVFQNHIDITNDLALAGSHSVVVSPTGEIFTSASVGSGLIQVRQFATDLTPGPTRGFTSGFNLDRVEHNSIALDGSGNVVVVGGMNSQGSPGRNHWAIKLPPTISGTIIWESNFNDPGNTYWHGVTTDGDEILSTGDFGTSLFGGTQSIYTLRFDAAGLGTWEDEYVAGGAPDDVGHAVALDGAGNFYVAGTVGTETQALNGVIVRYNSQRSLTTSEEYDGLASGNDEILDLAVDADGALYVVGYETTATQGENIWIRKYAFNTQFNSFDPVWQRTHHGVGSGNDRAISCAISGATLVVAGFESDSAGDPKLILRMYEK